MFSLLRQTTQSVCNLQSNAVAGGNQGSTETTEDLGIYTFNQMESRRIR
jgi:hypothetical protein